MTDRSPGPIDVSVPVPSAGVPDPDPDAGTGTVARTGDDGPAGAGGEGADRAGSADAADAGDAAVSDAPDAAASDATDTTDEPDEPDADDEPVYTIPTGPPPAPEEFRMALVASVTVDLPNPHPTVVLRETESPRRQLSFSIGFQDATALSHAMRRIPTPRPLTHELLSGILQGFDIDVVAVRLVGRQGAIYFAELDLRGRSGRAVHSCRPSDALTIALLQPVPVPILIDQRLLEDEGDVIPPGPGRA